MTALSEEILQSRGFYNGPGAGRSNALGETLGGKAMVSWPLPPSWAPKEALRPEQSKGRSCFCL